MRLPGGSSTVGVRQLDPIGHQGELCRSAQKHSAKNQCGSRGPSRAVPNVREVYTGSVHFQCLQNANRNRSEG
jgi:hypothetical protein